MKLDGSGRSYFVLYTERGFSMITLKDIGFRSKLVNTPGMFNSVEVILANSSTKISFQNIAKRNDNGEEMFAVSIFDFESVKNDPFDLIVLDNSSGASDLYFKMKFSKNVHLIDPGINAGKYFKGVKIDPDTLFDINKIFDISSMIVISSDTDEIALLKSDGTMNDYGISFTGKNRLPEELLGQSKKFMAEAKLPKDTYSIGVDYCSPASAYGGDYGFIKTYIFVRETPDSLKEIAEYLRNNEMMNPLNLRQEYDNMIRIETPDDSLNKYIEDFLASNSPKAINVFNKEFLIDNKEDSNDDAN